MIVGITCERGSTMPGTKRHTELPKGRLLEVINAAQCRNADPNLMTSDDPADQIQALGFCAGCRVQPECYSMVNPIRSMFTGVCGGRIFHDGRDQSLKFDAKVMRTRYAHLSMETVSMRNVRKACAGAFTLAALSNSEQMLMIYILNNNRPNRITDVGQIFGVTALMVRMIIGTVSREAPPRVLREISAAEIQGYLRISREAESPVAEA